MKKGRDMLIKNILVSLLLAIAIGSWLMYKTHDVTIQVEAQSAKFKLVKGCDGIFEGKHVNWPEPEKDSNCRLGWEFRESMDGVAISQIVSSFKSQRFLDLTKLSGFVFLITLFILQCIIYIKPVDIKKSG